MSTEALGQEAQAFEAAQRRIIEQHAPTPFRGRLLFAAGRDYGLELRGPRARDVETIRRLVDAIFAGHQGNFENCIEEPCLSTRALVLEVQAAYPLGEEGAE
jgi:hypothetical protein